MGDEFECQKFRSTFESLFQTPNADFAIFLLIFASIFIKFLYEFLNFLKNRITIPFAKFYVKF